MKKEIKGFIIGVILTSIILTSYSVFAIGTSKTISILLNSVSIKINSKKLQGDNILFGGNIYARVDNISTLMNKKYIWDKKSNIINITDIQNILPAPQTPSPTTTNTTTPTNSSPSKSSNRSLLLGCWRGTDSWGRDYLIKFQDNGVLMVIQKSKFFIIESFTEDGSNLHFISSDHTANYTYSFDNGNLVLNYPNDDIMDAAFPGDSNFHKIDESEFVN